MRIKTFVFQIRPSSDMESIWNLLEEAGCVLLYADYGETQQIFGNLPQNLTKEELLRQYPEIFKIEAIELPEIDWEAQWAAQGNYHEGFLHVDLHDYAKDLLFQKGSHLKLIPGPGFGDLSHPTTRLILRLMPSYIQNQHVIDVGSGSGILSLAAISMGAHIVCGIDIEEKALIHSRTNSECNEMEEKIAFLFPEDYQKNSEELVVLMNMIQSEQEVAWESLPSLSDSASVAITSGILTEGRAHYLNLCSNWGWKLMEEMEEDGWLGFVFKVKTARNDIK